MSKLDYCICDFFAYFNTHIDFQRYNNTYASTLV